MDSKERFSEDVSTTVNYNEHPTSQEINSHYTEGSCHMEVNSKVPFCCAVTIPHGFHYVPLGKYKVAYSLNCLSVVKESCRKTIHVDGCGPVEVNLNLLKVVGCIPILANAEVHGECSNYCGTTSGEDNHIQLCCSNNVCIDTVLKCSVACLPSYVINCHNVIISNIQVTPIQDHGCNLLRFNGMIEFNNIPC